MKTFVADHKALKVAKNMEFLKQSLTINRSIAIHDAIIGRDEGDYIRIDIILPWASLGDLSQFLLDGTDDMNLEHTEHYYDFAEKFPRARHDPHLTKSLLKQSTQLAGALKFLHEGFDTKEFEWHVRCAHMDLNPTNILIFHSSESTVGKWKISDLGISVFRAEAKFHTEKTIMGSLGDYFARIKTNFGPMPGQHLGTFQAPELEFPVEYSNVEDIEDAKRRDVWSFGAILAEVSAYAFGRSASVKDFRERRTRQVPGRGRSGDLFYTPGTDQNPRHCALNIEVAHWLDQYNIAEQSAAGCLACWGVIVKRILIVDAEIRPDATKVDQWLQKLQIHITHPREEPCLDSNAGPRPPTILPSVPQFPVLLGVNHLGDSVTSVSEDFYAPTLDSYSPERYRPHPARYPRAERYSYPELDSPTDRSLRLGSDTSPSLLVESPKDAGFHELEKIDTSTRRFTIRSGSGPDRRSSNTTSSSGVRDSLIPLSATRSTESVHVSLISADVIDFDLDTAGGKIAYLTKLGVEVFQLLPGEPMTPQSHAQVPLLGKKNDWRGVRLSGRYLAIWGYINKRSEVSGERAHSQSSAGEKPVHLLLPPYCPRPITYC